MVKLYHRHPQSLRSFALAGLLVLIGILAGESVLCGIGMFCSGVAYRSWVSEDSDATYHEMIESLLERVNEVVDQRDRARAKLKSSRLVYPPSDPRLN